MSTIQEFENAPVGATATSPRGSIAFKTARSEDEWSLYGSHGRHFYNLSSDEMGGFTLNPTAPTTAREALDLAWNLAHPVKVGQVVPAGTEIISVRSEIERAYGTTLTDQVADGFDESHTRTLDPLPDPEPDWLDAPAVLAAMNECSWQKVWLPRSGGQWICTCCGAIKHWSKMADVTPLYPKEDKGGMYITGSGEIQFKDRNGQNVWEI